MKKILVTGASGFIGFHTIKKLLDSGFKVVGIDNINNYYDRKLKKDRLNILKSSKYSKNFIFHKIDLVNNNKLKDLFLDYSFDYVIHLAAQAGVRYSIDNPKKYVDSNLVGFNNLIEILKNYKIKHFIFASSSSIYGLNKKQPFSEDDITDAPISLYAATKKANELIAHSYSSLYELPITALRFFTVYGPYGRPDMAYFKFTKSIIDGNVIDIYNNGKMRRDFTYVDDIVWGIFNLINKPPKKKKSYDSNFDVPFRVLNIGNNNPVSLAHFVKSIEISCSMKAKKNYLPMQLGDVKTTFADINKINRLINFEPKTSIEVGIENFVKWYKTYYKI